MDIPRTPRNTRCVVIKCAFHKLFGMYQPDQPHNHQIAARVPNGLRLRSSPPHQLMLPPLALVEGTGHPQFNHKFSY
uniref:Uncharacterized protein n=1 Tax=Picea glauca TaxID=3330 RepID=A0A117NHL9_PICGL|nr:hypothetical protein ABT39_MTgene4607 [Picea glauca]